jgi:hypothetical protein
MLESRLLISDLSAELYGIERKDCECHDTRFLNFLVKFDHHDECYALTDLKSRDITWSHGINKWLGYKDATPAEPLAIGYLTQFVHPFLRDWYQMCTNAAMLTLTNLPTTSLRSRFVVNVPMRMANGQLLLVKQMSMPLDYDPDGKIVNFMDSYMLVGEYRQEPMKMAFYLNQEEQERMQQQFQKYVSSCVKIHPNYRLTTIHTRVIDGIRSLRANGEKVTSRSLADKIGTPDKPVEPNTAVKYQKKLRERLIELMQHDREKERIPFFPSATKHLNAIDFFDESGIICRIYPEACISTMY